MKRILAGPHAVTEALHAAPGQIEVVCVAETMRPTSIRHIEDLARRARVAVEILPRVALDQLSGELNHQGVVAITGSYPYFDFETLIADAKKQISPLVVVLDQVQYPQNLGAIMRSAYAFGAAGIVITKHKAAGVTPSVVRVSAGASELVRTARVTNLVRCLDRFRDEGFLVFGATMNSSTPPHALGWLDRCVLVLGNEGSGLRRLTREHCDKLFTIPLEREFDSLNVSAAASIALYEAARQRMIAKNVKTD
jgi:23S rRNA (guanosine2251-2'-O)-methyltransferase